MGYQTKTEKLFNDQGKIVQEEHYIRVLTGEITVTPCANGRNHYSNGEYLAHKTDGPALLRYSTNEKFLVTEVYSQHGKHYRDNGFAEIWRDDKTGEVCLLTELTQAFFRNGKEVTLDPVAYGMSGASLNRDALWCQKIYNPKPTP